MSLASMAVETLRIVDQGAYESASGTQISIAEAVAEAVGATRLYEPEAVQKLVDKGWAGAHATRLEVTTESTTGAGLRLLGEGESDVCVLNFASARNVGGGFLRGSRAQEEELCRGSALFRCLATQQEYYTANRAQRSALYTDALIYSPRVPFFRDESRRLIETPVRLSVITSPAPNTGAIRNNSPHELDDLAATFHRRARQVLAVAAEHRCTTLVLGAWGCGAFQGDPAMAADAFAEALEGPFRGVFPRVVFAILVKTARDAPNVSAFRARLACD